MNQLTKWSGGGAGILFAWPLIGQLLEETGNGSLRSCSDWCATEEGGSNWCLLNCEWGSRLGAVERECMKYGEVFCAHL